MPDKPSSNPAEWAYQPGEDLQWHPGELSPGPGPSGVAGLHFRWINKGESLFAVGGYRIRLNLPQGSWGKVVYAEKALVAEDSDGKLVASILCHIHERGRDDASTHNMAEPRYLTLEYVRVVEPWRGLGVFTRMSAIIVAAHPGMPIRGIAVDKTGAVKRFFEAHKPTFLPGADKR